jgi:hypothetical protein
VTGGIANAIVGSQAKEDDFGGGRALWRRKAGVGEGAGETGRSWEAEEKSGLGRAGLCVLLGKKKRRKNNENILHIIISKYNEPRANYMFQH